MVLNSTVTSPASTASICPIQRSSSGMISYHCIAETLSLNAAGISDGCRMHVPQALGIDPGRLSEVAFEFANEVRQAGVADVVCGLAHIGPAQQEPACLLHTQLFQELQRRDARRRLEHVREAGLTHIDHPGQVPHGGWALHLLLHETDRRGNRITLYLACGTLQEQRTLLGPEKSVDNLAQVHGGQQLPFKDGIEREQKIGRASCRERV